MRSALLLAVALLLPAAAGAQPTFGLRLGYAPSFGTAAPDVPASEVQRAQLPLQAEALWRFGAASAGAYLSYALGVGSDACRGGDCSGSALHAGIQGLYRFPPFGSGAFPWLGAGAGWERATLDRERLGSEVSWTWSGLELLAQGGVTWPLRNGFGVGPFVQLAVGRYTRLAVDTPEASSSSGIGDAAVHGWLHLGVRATLDLR